MEATTRKIVRWVLVPAAVVYCLASWGVPFIALLWPGIMDTDSGLQRCIRDGETAEMVWLAIVETAKLSGAVTLICMLLAFAGVAFTHATSPRLFRSLLLTAVFTMWINPVMRIFAWLVVLQPSSPLGQALRFFLPGAHEYAFFSTVVGMSSFLLPFAVLAVGAAATRIGPDKVQLSQILRLSRWRTCKEVYLPPLRSSLLLGGCLVFLLSLGYYITPQILGGGRVVTVSTVIAHLWLDVGSVNVSAFLALILFGLGIVPMLVIWRGWEVGSE